MRLIDRIKEDINTVFREDPAAKSVIEIVLCYSGLHAIWWHRISSWFWLNGFKTFGRFVSQIGRFFTAVEIHPGAKIGRRFFIDHGMGVVIGAGAILLGPIIIGDGARVGAGSVVVKDVPENATAVGVPGRVILPLASKRISGVDLDHNKLPDPVIEVLGRLEKRIEELERKCD